MRRISLFILTAALLILGAGLSQAGASGYFIPAESDKLTIPEMDWALGLQWSGFEVREHRMSPDGEHRFIYARDPDRKINMTIHVLKARKKGGHGAYREYFWKEIRNDGYKRSGIKRYEADGRAFLEYMIRENEGEVVDQKNIIAFISHNGVWASVHVSTMPFKNSDMRKLKDVLRSVSVVDDYEPDSLLYGAYASHFYLHENYQKAIVYYEKALASDEKSGELDDNTWIVLVDNLAMAYGMSGYLDEAIETLNHGLRRHPEYPMFYYNLACAYAEKQDLETTLENLRKAYKYEGNMLEGENMPDPRKDPSFKRYKNNERFLAVLEELGYR